MPVCYSCGTEETIVDDGTKLNTSLRCRRCQRAIDVPRPWKKDNHYGCYFPSSDLNVGENGGRGTGKPHDVVWL